MTYAVALLAYRAIDKFDVFSDVAVIEATSEAEADGIGMRFLRFQCPASEGWKYGVPKARDVAGKLKPESEWVRDLQPAS